MEYSEKHYISDWGIKLLFFISVFTMLAIMMYAIATEMKAGTGETGELIITTVFVAATEVFVYFLVFRTPLQIRIGSEGIYYRYRPFVWNEKLLAYSEIAYWKMRKVSPFGEFNGWGYRKRVRKKMTGLVLKDGQGFEFKTTNDTTLVMTSDNAELMAIAIRKYAADKEIK